MLHSESRTWKHEVRLLRLQVARFPGVSERRVKRALWNARETRTLISDGVYTPECRALILELCANGVPDMAVGKVLSAFARAWGLILPKVPSARTVGRIKIEAGIASKIQIISEMKDAGGTRQHMPCCYERCN